MWNWFIELRRRQPKGLDLSPISHESITCWSEGLRINVTPFERQVIVRIDDVFIDFNQSKKKDKNE